MTAENQPDPFEGFSSPTQEDIDVALKSLPIRFIGNEFDGFDITYKGFDSKGKPFTVTTSNRARIIDLEGKLITN